MTMQLEKRNKHSTGRLDRRLLVAVLFLACASVAAIAKAATRSVEGLEFDGVVVWGSVEVEIAQGDEPELRYRGSDSDLEPEPFQLRGGKLHLGRDRSGNRVGNVRYKVTMPELESLKLTGSGDVYVKPFKSKEVTVEVEGSGDVKLFDMTAEEVTLRMTGSGGILAAVVGASKLEALVSGSGDIRLGEVSAKKMDVSMSGSGDIGVDGEASAGQVQINLMGSGDIDLSEVSAQHVSVNIIGSGDTSVWANESLSVSILGSGDVRYRGDVDPSSSILGSGNVVHED